MSEFSFEQTCKASIPITPHGCLQSVATLYALTAYAALKPPTQLVWMTAMGREWSFDTSDLKDCNRCKPVNLRKSEDKSAG